MLYPQGTVHNTAISGDHSRDDSEGAGYTPLLECNAPGTSKGVAMKKKIIKR